MSEEPAVIRLTRDDVLAQYERIMAQVPYGSIAEFRDSVRAGYDCPCTNCYEYSHPHAREWSDLTSVLWMLDVDWKTATAETRP